jgi:hypothetical protein
VKRSTPLRRTAGFKSKLPERPPREERARPPLRPIRVPVPAAPVFNPQPKGIEARPGKRPPTALEARWMDAIVRYGCIACRRDGHAPRQTAVHHILRGGVRLGHRYTLPLCDPGHHQNGGEDGLVSRHPYKARFEERYGAEMALLAELVAELGFVWPN